MEELASVYARALFEVAEEHDVLDDIHEQLDEFADALSESRELQVFFFSPYFSSGEKKDGVAKVIEGGNEYFVRFLELLAEKHRLPVLFRIRREVADLTVLATERVTRKTLGPEDHERLIKDALDEFDFSRLPGGSSSNGDS